MRGCGSRGFRGAAALLYLVGCAMASPVLAQGIGGGGLIQSYTFDEPEVVGLGRFRLVTAPFAVAIPLGRYLGVVASGAWAEGVATGPGGEEVTLSGLTDTQLGIAVGLGRDRAVLSGGVTLPTGQSTQTLGETAVAGVVSAELLPFAIKSWGTGGGAGGDLALAFDAGRWGIGLSGGYQAAREYEPLSGEAFAYRPGDQIRARLALDRDVGESGTLSVLIGLQSFGEDEAQGNNLFKSGNRLEGVMSYAFALGLRGSALAYAGIYHRENGSLLTEDQVIDGAADSPLAAALHGRGQRQDSPQPQVLDPGRRRHPGVPQRGWRGPGLGRDGGGVAQPAHRRAPLRNPSGPVPRRPVSPRARHGEGGSGVRAHRLGGGRHAAAGDGTMSRRLVAMLTLAMLP